MSVMRCLSGFSVLLFCGCLVAACGGGGGSSSPTSSAVTYSGLTTQAILNTSDQDMVLDAYNGGELTGAMVTTLSAGQQLPAGDPVIISSLFNSLASGVPWSPQAGTLAASPVTGPCGGSVTQVLTRETEVDVAGSMAYADYCSENMIWNGRIDFVGTRNAATDDVFIEMTFNRLSLRNGRDSLTTSGRVTTSFNLSSTTSSMVTTLDMVLLDAVSNKSVWLNNYSMTLRPGSPSDLLSLEGRYYDHDRGFLTFSTPEPFILDDTGVPQGGYMLFLGVGSRAVLTAVGGGAYELEIDAGSARVKSSGAF